MAIFACSDEHYHHTNILKYCNRPFDNVDEMNENLIQEHNAIVKDGDTVYHLGDFTFQPVLQAANIIKKLNGKHFFIRGNHDSWLSKTKTNITSDKLIEIINFLVGKDKVVGIEDYLELKVNGHHIVMSHFPMLTWHKNHRGSIQIHGHCHGTIDELNEKMNVKRIDVGVDSAFKLFGKYRPFKLQEVIDIADKRGINPPDWFENVERDKKPEE